MREGYAVQILKMGEPILTIERRCLSGAELSPDDEEAIREAAKTLKSFVGDGGGEDLFPPDRPIFDSDGNFTG